MGFQASLRVGILALIAVAFWFLARDAYRNTEPVPASAPAIRFSAMRADATLARILGPEKPHPAATQENAAVRARIIAEFAKIGVKATTYRGFGCNANRHFALVACATVMDIIAEVQPGEGKAVVLLAHYDSVPAGPGAADDGSGVATVIETARALKARRDSAHPVIAIITDGEEYGLLGAAAFLDNPALRARVGAVVNVEARGNRGPSILFQTSPGDGKLIDLYARNVPHYATSSLYAEIYRFLPNDTDLTLFIRDGFTSFNFAFVGNVAHYHTPLDRRVNLSLVTLQQHGDNMLGVATALEHTDFASLKGGNDIYVDFFGRALPRMAASWALPLSVLSFLMIAAAAWLSRSPPGDWRKRALAGVLPLALLISTTLIGFALHYLAQAISGMPNPSFAHPLAMRIALALGVWGVVLLFEPFISASVVWLWFSGLAIIVAIFVTGFTPYFLFPSLVAAVLLLATSRRWNTFSGQIALFVAAVPALALWIGFVAQGEDLMGLSIPPLFTLPATFGLFALMPLMRMQRIPIRVWRISLGAIFAGAVAASAIAAFEPAYSEIAPLRLNLNYVEDHSAKRALWAADANAPLPQNLRAAAKFGNAPEEPYPSAYQKAYIAPAGALRFSSPTASITRNGKTVTLALHGSPKTSQMYVSVPKAAALSALTINGKHFAALAEWAKQDQVVIACMTGDCRNETLTLEFASQKSVTLMLAERRAGLPPFGKFLSDARPKTAVPSQMADGTFILTNVTVR